ncbi:hypothetical protein Bca52824_064439 [Brassica carinata]|uniref:Uncharacterized protein n=1 Tax=Brassica carinata TaxID=52824 RepID=A0A8X7QGC5_BRACI|nr:hypothetical protein Bca52824_064439 [Brassica carinata]
MISELGRRPMLRDSSFGDDYEKEIGASLGEKCLTCTEAAPLRPLWTVPLAPLPEGFSAADVGLVEEMGLVVIMRSLGDFL